MNTTGPAPQIVPSTGDPSALAVVKPDRWAGIQRAIQIGLRSLHLVFMGLVLGGVPMGATWQTLRGPIIGTLTTGVLLLLVCMRWGCLELTKGAGWAVLLKLGLLGLGNLFESVRLECYVCATIVASVGSHMPSAWRHFSLPQGLRRRATPGPQPE
jgi:hypothetical protein